MLLENLEKLDTKFEKIIEKHIDMQTKIILFDDKIEKLSDSIDEMYEKIEYLEKGHYDLYKYKIGAESQVKNILGTIYNVGATVYKIALPVIVGYILYAIGLPKWVKNFCQKLDSKILKAI